MSKKNFVNFYEYNLDCSATQTAWNINKVWREGSVNKCTVQFWVQKFYYEVSLEVKIAFHWRWEIVNIGRGESLYCCLTTCKRGRCKYQISIWTLNKIGKFKKLAKWVPNELNKNQNNHHYEVCSVFLLHNENDPFPNNIVM